MTDPSGVNLRVIEEFRSTGGSVPSLVWFLPGEKSPSVLLLTTTRVSDGVRRTTPLTYIPDDDHLVVFVVPGERARPDWYDDLITHPDAMVEVGSRTVDIVATIPTDAETGRLYRRRATAYPWFEEQAPTDGAAIVLTPHYVDQEAASAKRPWSATARSRRPLPADARQLGRWSRVAGGLPILSATLA
ncbi:MAG TPA: nitroreductase/quinone reductase family protein [Mycobacteriales bacterium]|jgi:deazaflavin-dependent oxidoreductase (nitroreductase family)